MEISFPAQIDTRGAPSLALPRGGTSRTTRPFNSKSGPASRAAGRHACSLRRKGTQRPGERQELSTPTELRRGTAWHVPVGSAGASGASHPVAHRSRGRASAALALHPLLTRAAGAGANPFPPGSLVRARTARRVVSSHLCNFSGDETVKARLQAFQTTSPAVNKGQRHFQACLSIFW